MEDKNPLILLSFKNIKSKKMAKTIKKAAAPKKVAKASVNKAAAKVSPIKGVAQSIAKLSHDDRVKLHDGFTKNIDFDNNSISVGKTPDGSNYTEWVNSFE